MTRLTIDELEVLTPDQLMRLLFNEVSRDPMDFQHIKDLLAVGCPIEARDGNGRTALHWAAERGHLGVVGLLVSREADVNARDDGGWSVLHIAAFNGHLEVVEFLISIGADIHARNRYGNSAFDVAAPKIKDLCPELEPK